MTQFSKQYDLEERTAKFGEEIIRFCKNIKETNISRPIINQLIRSATSIGANYMEANGASSRNDFRNKIFICKKESQETKHWLRMLNTCDLNLKIVIQPLWLEAQHLTMIFQKITNTLNKRV